MRRLVRHGTPGGGNGNGRRDGSLWGKVRQKLTQRTLVRMHRMTDAARVIFDVHTVGDAGPRIEPGIGNSNQRRRP